VQTHRRLLKHAKEIEIPWCVIDCNYKMGAVNLKDQLLHIYMFERKKWLNSNLKFSNCYWNLPFSVSCCVSTRDGMEYTAALVQNSSIGNSVYEICTCSGNADCNGSPGILTTQFHGWLNDIFWENWQNWKTKTSVELCIDLKAQKKETYVYYSHTCDVRPLGNLLWAASHETHLLRQWQLFYCFYIVGIFL